MTTYFLNKQNETTLSVSFAQRRTALSLFTVSICVVLGSFTIWGMRMQAQSVGSREVISETDSDQDSKEITQLTQSPAKGMNHASPTAPSRTIVIGFVGGRVHPDNSVHREVQIARHLQCLQASNAEVEVSGAMLESETKTVSLDGANSSCELQVP
jgi:hypothetical protein